MAPGKVTTINMWQSSEVSLCLAPLYTAKTLVPNKNCVAMKTRKLQQQCPANIYLLSSSIALKALGAGITRYV